MKLVGVMTVSGPASRMFTGRVWSVLSLVSEECDLQFVQSEKLPFVGEELPFVSEESPSYVRNYLL